MVIWRAVLLVVLLLLGWHFAYNPPTPLSYLRLVNLCLVLCLYYSVLYCISTYEVLTAHSSRNTFYSAVQTVPLQAQWQSLAMTGHRPPLLPKSGIRRRPNMT